MKKLFLFLLSVVGALTAQAQTSPYTGSEVGEGDFYLYNVGTGLWIQNIDANNRRSDDNWNTGAGMGTAGFDFALTAVDGGYNLDPKENPRKLGWGYGDGGILYLDGNIGGNTHWDFTKVEAVSNGYKISIDDHVLGVEVVEGKAFLINNATENDVWQLVTKAERLEKMQTLATEGKPYDLSFLLGDWNFATNNTRRSQWVEKRDGGNDDGFPRARRWNSSHLVWNTNSYSWTQTVSDLPNGVYQFSVQGMYRDGNRNQVGAKAAEGKTELLAKYFIGAAEGSLMSILAQASETKGDGFETAIENTDPQLYAPDNADNWTIVWALHPDKYWNAPIKVNVRGGSVEVGVRKTSIIGGDWLAMNEFKLEYVGPIDATIYKEALQTAITTAEGFKGTTTEALATALATALSDAKALVESDDIDAIEAKTNALNTARSAAEAVNPTDLIATIALAKAEGIDVTAAEEVAKTATEAAPVNEALNSLRLARQIKAADKAENVWAGNAPAAGDFYIYNVGQKRFLCGGADWGAHAALGFPGINVTLVGEGEYRLDTHLNNGGEKEFLGYNGYCDTDAQDTWKFIQVSEGVYNIARTADNNLLLGYTTNTFANVDTDKADGADPNNQWILVTKADRDALIAKASESNPVDVSYLIQSPGFNQREAIDKWKMEGYSIWGRGGNHPDFICESWNTTSNKLTQTIENLPAGIYKVAVQGYFRDGDHENQVQVAATRAQLATFSANGASILLPNILDGVNKAPGLGSKTEVGEFPYDATQAANFFRNGLYKTELTAVVGTDGKLEISISKSSKNFDRDWVVVDNFRLTFVKPIAEEELPYEKALANIQDGAYYRISTEAGDKKYYVTEAGGLTDAKDDGGIFSFTKVTGGAFKEYGFYIDNGSKRFTNPPLSNNMANLTPGAFATSTNNRKDWEAQVIFMNAQNQIAIRSCNTAHGTSSWADAGRTFWTWAVEEAPVPQYTYDTTYVWRIEGPLTPIQVTYELYEADGETKVSSTTKKQEANGNVSVPADMTANFAYNYAVTGTVGAEDCTIKVVRTFKAGVVHKLEELSNAKAYTIRCDRGALLTKDGYMASTAHSSLKKAEAANFAVISYEDNYYLYSVDDKKFVTNSGELADIPVNGVNDAICMTAQTDPYFMYYFCVGTSDEGNAINYGLNTNGNDPYGYVINSWMNADPGNKYYMVEAADFDATEALKYLAYGIHPTYFATYEIKDAAGKVLLTSEKVPTYPGAKITSLPTELQRVFTEYSKVDATISEENENTTIDVIATWNGPVTVEKKFGAMAWNKMYLKRGENRWYLANVADAAGNIPSLVKNPTEEDLEKEEYNWGFLGNAYEGLKIYNQAAGDTQTLTNGESGIAMAEGAFVWNTLAKNGDGILFGTDGDYLNQAGGDGNTKLGLWYDAADAGSTYFIEAIPLPEVILDAPSFVIGKEAVTPGTQAEPNILPAGTKLQIKCNAKGYAAYDFSPKDLKVKITVMASGDKPGVMTMPPAHFVRGEEFFVNVGTTDFPVELIPGYVYQNIVILSAELMTKETEEVMATYTGEPVQLQWVGVAAPTYAITIADGIQNGTVEADKATAAEGETVALTIKPAENYELDKLIVTAGDAIIPVAEDNTFVMPAEAVTINASFKIVTGIKDIKALQGAEIYDLGGSKTQKIQKGKAYIIDGKTVIAK